MKTCHLFPESNKASALHIVSPDVTSNFYTFVNIFINTIVFIYSVFYFFLSRSLDILTYTLYTFDRFCRTHMDYVGLWLWSWRNCDLDSWIHFLRVVVWIQYDVVVVVVVASIVVIASLLIYQSDVVVYQSDVVVSLLVQSDVVVNSTALLYQFSDWCWTLGVVFERRLVWLIFGPC